jgi:DNA-binding NtrC family response regulator
LIEEGSFHRVGGETAVPFRARIVAATHRDLATEAGASGFRQDLYFRLAVLPVEIPPLRRRPEDISWLMERFLDNAAGRTDSAIRGFSALAEEAALAHDWRGNARELKNRVERAVVTRLNGGRSGARWRKPVVRWRRRPDCSPSRAPRCGKR